MSRLNFKKVSLVFVLLVSMVWSSNAQTNSEKPNIVFILCDDLGYGDIQCLAPETSKIKTPHVDKLAQEGMVFTDAHSGSSVCTRTRYGIMTGRYSWRTKLQSRVVSGFAPDLITENRPTNFLKMMLMKSFYGKLRLKNLTSRRKGRSVRRNLTSIKRYFIQLKLKL